MQSLFLTNLPQQDPDVYGPLTLLKITRKEKKNLIGKKINSTKLVLLEATVNMLNS